MEVEHVVVLAGGVRGPGCGPGGRQSLRGYESLREATGAAPRSATTKSRASKHSVFWCFAKFELLLNPLDSFLGDPDAVSETTRLGNVLQQSEVLLGFQYPIKAITGTYTSLLSG